MSSTPRVVAIVDDNVRFQELCARILEPAGYKHLAIFESNKVTDLNKTKADVMVLDFRLAEAGDLELLKALRINADLPVVICTAAHDAVEQQREFIEGLGCEIVEKPFEVDDFLGAIERSLSSSSVSQ